MRIGLLLDYALGDPAKPVINELIVELQRRGCAVRTILPSGAAIDLASFEINDDLYIAKGHSEPMMALGGILHDRGALLVNPYPASCYVHDKARTTAALLAAGIPVPRSCIANNALDAFQALGCGPIIFKPVNGHRGWGIEVAKDRHDLKGINSGPHFAQSYERINGDDLKVYVIGTDVFTVRRRVDPPAQAERVGQLCASPPEVVEIAMRMMDLFGMDICGFDIVETCNGPVVVDVNAFPSFRGVPDAAERLADIIMCRGHRQETSARGVAAATRWTGLAP